MTLQAIENVADYPRPPAIEAYRGHILVRFGGQVIAETKSSFRILETFHPPTYYLPLNCFSPGALKEAGGRPTLCEWKGEARYYDVLADGAVAPRAAWTYPAPTPAFTAIADHIALYAEPLQEVLIDGVSVIPQPGNFYGGWVTPNITGPIKGAPGTTHW